MSLRLTRLGRYLPGPADAIFGFVLVLLLLGGRHGLLNDPGTPWHLRLGREIIASGSVPRSDTLTFTREGAAWVDQSWAFDVLLALLVDRWGWSAAIALASLGLAWLYRTMARDMIRDGASPVIAAVVSVFAVCIGAIHFLLRPHLFTFAFVYLALRACQAQHERGGWAVVKVTLYTLILANVHGGFVALPLIVATAGLGHALSGAWDAARKQNTAKFGLAFLACLLAALVNPYGIGALPSRGELACLERRDQPDHRVSAATLRYARGQRARVGASRVNRFAGRIGVSHRPLSIVPRAGVAAPGADVDQERAAVCAGGRACARHADRRLATRGARRLETPGAPGPSSRARDLRLAVSGDGRGDSGRVRPQEVAARGDRCA